MTNNPRWTRRNLYGSLVAVTPNLCAAAIAPKGVGYLFTINKKANPLV